MAALRDPSCKELMIAERGDRGEENSPIPVGLIVEAGTSLLEMVGAIVVGGSVWLKTWRVFAKVLRASLAVSASVS